MIIVDNALKRARGRGPPDPGRHGRRRLHGPGPDQPDHQQRARACGWRRSTTASPSGPRTCTATPGVEDVAHVDTQARVRRRRTAPGAAWWPRTRMLLCRSPQIDVLVDVTGSVEFGAHVVPRGVRARQARRADERRGRRDDRPDPADVRQARTA